jgi:hypothetical protein
MTDERLLVADIGDRDRAAPGRRRDRSIVASGFVPKEWRANAR